MCWVDGEAYEDSVRALGTDDLFSRFDAIGEPFLWIVDAAHARVLAGGDDAPTEAVDGHPLALALLGRAVRAGHQPGSLHDRLHARGGSLLDTLADEDMTGTVVRDAAHHG